MQEKNQNCRRSFPYPRTTKIRPRVCAHVTRALKIIKVEKKLKQMELSVLPKR